MQEPTPLLSIEHLSVSFDAGKGRRRVQAADGVSMTIYPGQTLAVVGESGSGKSVSAMTVLKLVPMPPGRWDQGKVLWQLDRRSGLNGLPAPDADNRLDLATLGEKQMRSIRGSQIAMIFQEPMTSLNPVYTIGEQITEAVLLHRKVSTREAIDIAAAALRDVGIAEPTQRLKEYPHQLSGGMRQRVMIAMALACEPRLLLADEPTTALDVTIQAQILELLRKLQHERGMAVMLITHDLGVVAENADVVAVMFAGRIVEYADVETLFSRPLHPYTRGLLASMPVLGRHSDRLPTVMDGATIPDDLPAGFKVMPHDPTLNPEGGYNGPTVKLHEVEPGHWLLCEKLDDADAHPAVPRCTFRRGAAAMSHAPN